MNTKVVETPNDKLAKCAIGARIDLLVDEYGRAIAVLPDDVIDKIALAVVKKLIERVP